MLRLYTFEWRTYTYTQALFPWITIFVYITIVGWNIVIYTSILYTTVDLNIEKIIVRGRLYKKFKIQKIEYFLGHLLGWLCEMIMLRWAFFFCYRLQQYWHVVFHLRESMSVKLQTIIIYTLSYRIWRIWINYK